ncbi:chaperone modulator CbpM [Methylomonas methanica]|uniref:Transcriptional regulatory protein, MerR family n=1 Tax=Methylomonas methanica (strain DSM 25384 / MC09) TaxID=857087 RepID=G0A5M7_METMM|nr:chaperone modulator CbpM [Methylomonas methanica]AEG02884.1 transcriptional regulatory protein, MerR family [Methylomonas methanica MC09]
MPHTEITLTAVIEDTYLSVEQLAALCSVEPEWVMRRIEEGLLSASKCEADQWCFTAMELTRAKRMLSIERNFEAQPELAALVADMQEELDHLRRQLLRAGQSDDCFPQR